MNRGEEKNLYLEVLKRRFLSLVIIPILVIGGIFYYMYSNGILYTSEYELFPMIPFFGIPVFIFIQLVQIMVYLSKKNLPEVFGVLVRLLIVISIWMGYVYYEPYLYTKKIENFAKERQYYLRFVSNFRIKRGLVEGINYNQKVLKAHGIDAPLKDAQCVVIYDVKDTLLEDTKYRKYLETLEIYDFGGWSPLPKSSSVHTTGKIYHVPSSGYKIEPKFYYMCFDFAKKTEIKK